jgi:putative peptidoglycan lipid II flippase
VPAASTPSVKFILNTALLLTALGMVVRASGAVKEVLFARAFGVSADTDAFVLAVTYATFLPNVLGASIATALIAERARNASGASTDMARLSVWVAAASCLCALCIYALAPWLMSVVFSLSGESLARATAYARILSPLGFAMVMSTAMEGLLNSEKQFYVAGICPLATPVITAAAILALAASWGVTAAAWGMVWGGLLEVTVLIARIYAQRGMFFRKHARGERRERVFWRAVALLSFAGFIAAVSPMVDQVFLARLDTGAITNLNYASKVNSLLIALFGTAFGAAIYPYLSDHAARRDLAGLKRLTWRLAALVVPASALTSLAVYALSYEIVKILFARGNFTETAVLEVSAIQQIFALQLVFYVAGLLAMRVLNAAGAARFVLVVSCVGVVSNTLFDWLFYQPLGARGIALASVVTSIVSLVASVLLIKPALMRPS